MKKIAFYIGDFKRSGGTERSSISVVNELAKKDKDSQYFVFVTNSKNDKPFFEINNEVNIVYLNIKSIKLQFLSLIYRIIKQSKKNKIDVIVAVEVYSLLFLKPAIKTLNFYKKSVKLIVWEHFNFTVNLGKKMRDKLRRQSAYFADAIVVLTKKDIELWKNGLDVKTTILAINNPSPFLIMKDTYKTENKKFVAIGRLTFQKGFDKLILIWKEAILKESKLKEWKLQLIGSGPDEKMLKTLIVESNVEDSVEMIPNTNNIGEYYKNAASLLMTSRFEGLPMTLIEAQSYGLPIIAYDCLTGPSDVISENSGYLIENDNQVEFVNKLIELINNPTQRQSMSSYALREVEKYQVENIGKQWIQLFETIFIK